MSYESAYRILTEKLPNLIQRSSSEQADRHIANVYWIVTERDQAMECIDFLGKWTWPSNYTNDSTPETKTVTDPITSADTLPGVWKYINATYSEADGEHRVILTIEAEINTTAPITSESTRWRYRNGKEWQFGNGVVTLELLHCDPSSIQTMVAQNGNESYADSIYTTNAGVLSGTWYNIFTESAIDQETGYGTLIWYLSRKQSLEFIFDYTPNTTTRIIEFFKLHVPLSAVDTFKDTYYFDSIGNWYTSTNGTTILTMNGEAYVGGDDIATVGAYRIDQSVAGRVIRVNCQPNDEQEVNIHVVITIKTGQLSATSFNENAFAKEYTQLFEYLPAEIDAQTWMGDGAQNTYFTPDGSPGSYTVPAGYTLSISNNPRGDDGLYNARVTVREAKRFVPNSTYNGGKNTPNSGGAIDAGDAENVHLYLHQKYASDYIVTTFANCYALIIVHNVAKADVDKIMGELYNDVTYFSATVNSVSPSQNEFQLWNISLRLRYD